jgi:membrane protease YdiL (CAAX protease family)
MVALFGLSELRALYLTRGALGAPIQPVWWLGFAKPDPWTRFGLQWGVYIALTLAGVLYLGMQPPPDVIGQALSILPSVLFYAALNAFNEEITYRASMLTTLEAAIGTRQAWAMSAFLFGIAHYFGTPGGVGGALAAIFMGWLLSKAMLETRGLFWAWWIHFLSDVAIFAVMTLALLS